MTLAAEYYMGWPITTGRGARPMSRSGSPGGAEFIHAAQYSASSGGRDGRCDPTHKVGRTRKGIKEVWAGSAQDALVNRKNFRTCSHWRKVNRTMFVFWQEFNQGEKIPVDKVGERLASTHTHTHTHTNTHSHSRGNFID